VIDLKPACEAMIDVLSGVTADQLPRSSPCTDYTVGDLIDHVDYVARLFTALAHKDDAELQGTDADSRATHLGDGWHDSVAQHVRALGKAWDGRSAWQGSTNMSGPDLANELWGKIALTEMVVHGWDIATATNAPFGLPEHTLDACLEHVTAFIPTAPVPALWGPPVEVATTAPLLDRIVSITGRKP
jgi:uncharacterized protein (TIGR03086 family)